MERSHRPFRVRRSCLAVPASSERFIAKARGLPADEVFLDLEDAVAPAAKAQARANAAAAVAGDWGGANNRVAVLHARLEKVPMQPPTRTRSECAKLDALMPVGSLPEHVPATAGQVENHAAKARAVLRAGRSGPPPTAEVLAERAAY